MDYVVAALLGVIIALLISILLEMGKLRAVLSRLPDPSRHSAEKEGHQTVTVNVGALVPTEGPPVTISEAPPPSEPEREPETVAPEAEAPPASHLPSKRPGGITAVKCPHCGSENSSFRNECFQCGKRL